MQKMLLKMNKDNITLGGNTAAQNEVKSLKEQRFQDKEDSQIIFDLEMYLQIPGFIGR